MRKLTPTSSELEKAAEALIYDATLEERQQWLTNKLTRGVFVVLEAARMKAFEAIEEGPEPHKLVQYMAQAQLAAYLTEELDDYYSGASESDEQD